MNRSPPRSVRNWISGRMLSCAEKRRRAIGPPLALLRARVLLTLLLPTGSEPGSYEVEIRDASATVKASAQGNADLRNQVTTLDVVLTLDHFRAVIPDRSSPSR